MTEASRFSNRLGFPRPSFCASRPDKLQNHYSAKTYLSLAISAALGLTCLFTGQVCAQDEQSSFEDDLALEEVVVTGTRIINKDGFGMTSPVTVIGMEAIKSSGFTRVEEILNKLPQMEADQTQFVSNGATGTGNLNLRGLGAKRNLVLINGRRMQPGGVYSMAPDINQIPATMIERIEVLTGGASATYGADAVAGVINFIIRRVQGVEVSAGINGYQHDNRNQYVQGLLDEKGFDYPTGNTGIDGKAYNVNIVIGGDFAEGRGNATLYANWRKNDSLLYGARDYASCALNVEGTACGGSGSATEIPNFFIAPLTEDGFGPYGYDYWQEEFAVLQPDSSLLTEDWRNPSNLYNYAPINHYLRPDERWSFGAFVDYEINEHAIVYLETMGFNDQSTAQIAESGTFMAYVYPLALDNAYFPENFRQSLVDLWPGEDDFGIYIGKRNTEGGPRSNQFEHTSFRIVAGIKGLINDDWNYDVSYLQAQTSSSSVYINDFLAPKIAIAVDSRLCELDLSCIPYEVFTYQGVTEDAARSIQGTAAAVSSTGTEIFQAYVTGNTGWGLSAGDILAAAGFEHRKIDFERIADELYEKQLLLGQSFAVESIDGGYSVNELFVEANIPLLSGRTLAQNMTLDLAYRYSDYSTSGGSSTYRIGLDWQVVDWLRVRSGYNRAVRTPNIAELHSLQQLAFFGAEDPCAGEVPLYSLEQCVRTGVTADLYGNIQQTPYDALNVLRGGNLELDPEKANTLTAGLVFDIGESMRLSVDYWDIKIDDVIEPINPEIVLGQCALEDNLCELVQRGRGGSLWRGNESYIVGTEWNLGKLHSTGIDVAWNWSLNMHWNFNLIGTYYLKKETTVIPNQPETAWDCVGLAGGNGEVYCSATPKWRHTASTIYDSNSFWSVTGRWRYYSSVTYPGTEDEIANDNLGAQSYFDLSADFRFMESHDISIGVNNILDKEPPLVGNTIDLRGYYDSLGRFVFAQLTLRW